MPQISVSIDDFALTSEWTNSGGAITYGPTPATAQKTFTVSGIPSGSTPTAAAFSASFGSPYSGADTLTANSQAVGYGAQTFPLAPTQTVRGPSAVSVSF